MKMCTREGIGLASKKNEKEAITEEEEEEIFWAKNLLGTSFSQAPLNIVYFYSKLFGLRSADHKHNFK